jgi:hypothetical protein
LVATPTSGTKAPDDNRRLPIAATKPILWEVADVVEQMFTIALVEDLTPTPQDLYAAILGHQADHGLSVPQMRERLRCCYGTMREVDERARQVARLAVARLVRELDLDAEPPVPERIGPPAIFSNRGTRNARKGANT